MDKRDSNAIARHYDAKVLKALHKFGWLRTRDLAALIWMRGPRAGDIYEPLIVDVAPTARRKAQKVLKRLREGQKVISTQAPDGSIIYALSEAGARQLAAEGIPAKSGKDWMRRISLSHYHHRRIANELAIGALLQGYRASSEHEIATGAWPGGKKGVLGKSPDVIVRDGKRVWWVEVERSRRNEPDYKRLIEWLKSVWGDQRQPLTLPEGHALQKVVFVADEAFLRRLVSDLSLIGWAEKEIVERTAAVTSQYVTEAKFVRC